MKKNFFQGKVIQVLLHVIAWVILLGLPLYFIKRWDVGKDFIWLYYINITINGIIFYINYLILTPKYFFASRKYRYFISVFLLLLIMYFVSDSSNRLIFEEFPHHQAMERTNTGEIKRTQSPPKPGPFLARTPFRQIHMVNYSFTAAFLIVFSLGLRVLERHAQTEKSQKELEKEKLNSELAFLKNQISPHFFFNTLNNIYSLISINEEDSKNAVLKLSKLMRYLLYESEHGNTKLSNEIAFLNHYIDLMKLRMSDKISLSVSFPDEYEDISIPPLLFIPFIENAFKHGISYREKSFIEISMTTTKDTLSFRCVNSNIGNGDSVESDHTGIGLENVSKRLKLLFPGKHELKISDSDKIFKVLLDIKLS
ncbi:MAG TPA: histidine kinase [Bacteroidales bacterium]|nr:histidine kinase [Bacteroidales bacterium]